MTLFRLFFVSLSFFYTLSLFSQGFFSRRSNTEKNNKDSFIPQDVRSPEIPSHLEFAGEIVPLEDFDVREALERELAVNMYWHSQTLLIIKLANRFFPMIEPILQAQKIHSDFKYLCAAESGLRQLVSPAKAAGFWQILPSTGKQYGLEISDDVDERYHIEKATWSACNYLQKAHSLFGNWTMAAASYNMGMAGLTKQAVKQKSLSYYDMRLNEETSRYVYRILALKLIISNPSKYGFNIAPKNLYPPYKYQEVLVNTSVESWADFAIQYNTNYKMIKLLNPWLRNSSLANKKNRTYYIKIPEEGFRKNAYKLNNLSDGR
ncbi:MAG: lytic transglycosylase domain-containing protein [Bacteroidales bacterium]